MSGYIGDPDAEAEHAQVLADNGVAASRLMLSGSVRTHCLDCQEPIAEARRQVALKAGHKCLYCIACQGEHDKLPRIKMLDRIL